eukprot:15468529-Alexandrium_andersonii.AAC.1
MGLRACAPARPRACTPARLCAGAPAQACEPLCAPACLCARDQPAADAVLSLVYVTRRRRLNRLALDAAHTAGTSPSGRRLGDGQAVA